MVDLDFISSIDWEHSQVMQNLPMFMLLGFMLLSLLPQIPQEVRLPILMIGMVGGIGSLFVVDAWARVEASQYIPLKARIMPWNIERTFFCKKPTGGISSKPLGHSWYRTGFTLGLKTKLPLFGIVEEIKIDHKLPWTERNMGSEGYVPFRGMDIKHASVILVELWLPNFGTTVDFLSIIPCFRLESGTQDYILQNGHPKELTMVTADSTSP